MNVSANLDSKCLITKSIYQRLRSVKVYKEQLTLYQQVQGSSTWLFTMKLRRINNYPPYYLQMPQGTSSWLPAPLFAICEVCGNDKPKTIRTQSGRSYKHCATNCKSNGKTVKVMERPEARDVGNS
jgi:hypothetical protein